jgi:hypothetical protein
VTAFAPTVTHTADLISPNVAQLTLGVPNATITTLASVFPNPATLSVSAFLPTLSVVGGNLFIDFEVARLSLDTPGATIRRFALDTVRYHYAQINPIIPTPAPDNQRPLFFNTRLRVEHQLFDLKIPAERLELNGVRYFRLKSTFVSRLAKDQKGYFLAFGDEKLYFTQYDPVGFTPEWRGL